MVSLTAYILNIIWPQFAAGVLRLFFFSMLQEKHQTLLVTLVILEQLAHVLATSSV